MDKGTVTVAHHMGMDVRLSAVPAGAAEHENLQVPL